MRLLLTLVIVGVLPFLVRAVKNRRINCILLICYTIAVLIITLGSRSFENETHVGWNPIAVYQRAIQSVIQGWKTGGWAEAIKHLGWHRWQLMNNAGLNILLFVPFGYLAPSVFSFLRHWWRVLLTGLSFSLIVEGVQLITHLGWFDVSDLLHNTTGALIGYWIYWKWLRGTTEGTV